MKNKKKEKAVLPQKKKKIYQTSATEIISHDPF
jgi:hypothetical protein